MNTVSGTLNGNCSGYIMVDCDKLDLVQDDGKTFPGLYQKVWDAMLTTKQIIATNCRWDGHYMSSISVMGVRLMSDTIVCTASTLQIWLHSNGTVNIENMAPAE